MDMTINSISLPHSLSFPSLNSELHLRTDPENTIPRRHSFGNYKGEYNETLDNNAVSKGMFASMIIGSGINLTVNMVTQSIEQPYQYLTHVMMGAFYGAMLSTVSVLLYRCNHPQFLNDSHT